MTPLSPTAAAAAESPLMRDLESILYTREQIDKRVRELGEAICRDTKPGGELLLIGILKGGVYFLCDLSRAIPLPHAIDFVGASSYGAGTESSGLVKITKDLDTDVRGKHLVIVEDIYDTGHTMMALRQLLQSHGPASIRLCSMLSKCKKHSHEMPIDYVGFTIDDVFVVGYGLDYNERYRNLNCIGVLSPSVYRS